MGGVDSKIAMSLLQKSFIFIFLPKSHIIVGLFCGGGIFHFTIYVKMYKFGKEREAEQKRRRERARENCGWRKGVL